SPAFSAAPIGVVVSEATAGNSRFTKVLASTRMNRQQVPAAFSANAYLPRGTFIVRAVFTAGARRVCQSPFALSKYSERWTASVTCVGVALLVNVASENTGEFSTGCTNGVGSEIS